jgi:hypothetical protein
MSSIILAFLKFENIQRKNNSIFFAGEKIPRIVYFVAKRVGFTEVFHKKSTSAMATENKQQRFTIEKSKFAFTRKVETLEKNPEKSQG